MLADQPGTIALPTAEIGRFTMFMASLAGTRQPADTHLAVMASASVVENLNQIMRQLRPEDEWVWILGDDHIWQPDCLINLLAALDENLDADIIVPLVTKRNPPWHLVLFHETDQVHEDGLPRWAPWPWEDIPEHGMFEVDAAGSAGMLVRRQVLDEIGDPWFESTNGTVLNEDVIFCRKARAAGFRVFATADVVMGHLGIFNVRPARRDGRWGALTEFSAAEEQFKHLFMPTLDLDEPVVSGR
jgi:Glycosyltransferase like family 2